MDKKDDKWTGIGLSKYSTPNWPVAASLHVFEFLKENVVRPTRFELVTSCSGGKRSIQLSYGRVHVRLQLIVPDIVIDCSGHRAIAQMRMF